MKQVDQTIFGPKGNCRSACIASLLHLSIDEVPHFDKYDDYWERVKQWLIARGLFVQLFDLDAEDALNPDALPLGYYILIGKPPNCETYHCVVACGTVIVHDPMPTHKCLATREEYMVLVPLDPGEWTRKPAYTDES